MVMKFAHLTSDDKVIITWANTRPGCVNLSGIVMSSRVFDMIVYDMELEYRVQKVYLNSTASTAYQWNPSSHFVLFIVTTIAALWDLL